MTEINLNDIIDIMDEIEEDTSIPKNIRKTITDAKKRLKTNEDATLKIGAVVYSLEEIAEDINIPSHARTQIWTILSALESMKNDD
ncbi:UPF0147 family protein [Candidatus Micrarchaeota archaeon]|nr:UPF0147 family protein [Candidatus Micrarchaeota archaeon]